MGFPRTGWRPTPTRPRFRTSGRFGRSIPFGIRTCPTARNTQPSPVADRETRTRAPPRIDRIFVRRWHGTSRHSREPGVRSARRIEPRSQTSTHSISRTLTIGSAAPGNPKVLDFVLDSIHWNRDSQSSEIDQAEGPAGEVGLSLVLGSRDPLQCPASRFLGPRLPRPPRPTPLIVEPAGRPDRLFEPRNEPVRLDARRWEWSTTRSAGAVSVPGVVPATHPEIRGCRFTPDPTGV